MLHSTNLLCRFALFVNTDHLASSFLAALGMACSSDSSQFKFSGTKINSTLFYFKNFLHTLINTTAFSIPSIDTPVFHFKGSSLSSLNFKDAPHPVFQTGKEFFKYLLNYSPPLLRSSPHNLTLHSENHRIIQAGRDPEASLGPTLKRMAHPRMEPTTSAS